MNNKLSQYTAEITSDKLIVRSMDKGKVKLELAIQTIAPFLGLEKAVVSDDTRVLT